MEKIFKLFGIIVLSTIIGFSMVACDGDGGGDDNNGGQNGTNVFIGTWTGTDADGDSVTLVITATTWTLTGGYLSFSTGMYTYSGNTATIKDEDGNTLGTATLSGNTLTVTGSYIPYSPYTFTKGSSGGNNGSGTNPSAPTAPTGLTTTLLTSNSIRITWDAVSGATSYEIWYCKLLSNDRTISFNESTAIMAGTSATNSYTHSNLASSTKYIYKVKAVNSSGTSAFGTVSSSGSSYQTTPWGGGSFTATGLQEYNNGRGGVFAIKSNPMNISAAKTAVDDSNDVVGKDTFSWSSTTNWLSGSYAPSDGTYTIILYVGTSVVAATEWYKYTNVSIIGGTGSVPFNLDAGRVPGTGNRLGN